MLKKRVVSAINRWFGFRLKNHESRMVPNKKSKREPFGISLSFASIQKYGTRTTDSCFSRPVTSPKNLRYSLGQKAGSLT